jgi:hypothetical protein
MGTCDEGYPPNQLGGLRAAHANEFWAERGGSTSKSPTRPPKESLYTRQSTSHLATDPPHHGQKRKRETW